MIGEFEERLGSSSATFKFLKSFQVLIFCGKIRRECPT